MITSGRVDYIGAFKAGYFCRDGVLTKHWRTAGFGRSAVPLRAFMDIGGRARLNGWCSVISDTTDNLSSANNFIRAGYRLFQPPVPWAWPNTLYWRKLIG